NGIAVCCIQGGNIVPWLSANGSELSPHIYHAIIYYNGCSATVGIRVPVCCIACFGIQSGHPGPLCSANGSECASRIYHVAVHSQSQHTKAIAGIGVPVCSNACCGV